MSINSLYFNSYHLHKNLFGDNLFTLVAFAAILPLIGNCYLLLILWHCFHPWCPIGWVGRQREKVCPGLYLRNRKV